MDPSARLSVLVIPLPLATLASAGCDIVTADLRSEETAAWHKTYTLDANGRVEIGNVNGKITSSHRSGNTVDVDAVKKARGATPEAAKAALERATIAEDASSAPREDRDQDREASRASASTRQRAGRVPRQGPGRRRSEVHHGQRRDRDRPGCRGASPPRRPTAASRRATSAAQLEAIDDERRPRNRCSSRVAEGGVKLECTNGGIEMRLPRDAKATISASITNGGITPATCRSRRRREQPPAARGQAERRRAAYSDRRHQRRHHAVRPIGHFASRALQQAQDRGFGRGHLSRPPSRVRCARCATVFDHRSIQIRVDHRGVHVALAADGARVPEPLRDLLDRRDDVLLRARARNPRPRNRAAAAPPARCPPTCGNPST